MKLFLLYIVVMISLISCYTQSPKTTFCKNKLIYETNSNSAGEAAIKEGAAYKINLFTGDNNESVFANIDTAAKDLVLQETDEGLTQNNEIIYHHGSSLIPVYPQKKEIDFVCGLDLNTDILVSSKEYSIPNVLGLSYANNSFFDQLVQSYNYENMFSLALCGFKKGSFIILGGYDDSINIISRIHIIEKSSFVVPALKMLLADSKRVIGEFPHYDKNTKNEPKVILDSASTFLLLPVNIAQEMLKEIISTADKIGIINAFPYNFFNTDRGSGIKLVKFDNHNQIRQFPTFKIEFLGLNGKKEYLDIKPEYYFKTMEPKDELLRTFAIRHTQSDIVLGQPFMENYYMVFDRENGIISFGDINKACK